MSARLRTSPNYQCVCVKSPSGLKQSVLDGAYGDPNGRIGSGSSLQFSNAAAHLVAFLRLGLFLEALSNGQIVIDGLDCVDHMEVGVRLRRYLMSIAEHSFRVVVQADGAQPFAMFERSWRYLLHVSARYNGAIRVVEHLGGCRTKEHPPESTSMRRHDDEIEPTPGDLGDLCRHLSGNDDSWILREGKSVWKKELSPSRAIS
jgi:hypothetical protein